MPSLEAYISSIEDLEYDKAQIAESISTVYAEAKRAGYDTKVMRAVVKLRKLTPAQRRAFEGLLQLYKAKLGMLDGTPLGEAAISRLSKPPEAKPSDAPAASAGAGPNGAGNDTPGGAGAGTASPAEDAAPAAETRPNDTGQSIEEARALGAAAAIAGKPVTDNPFPPFDPRRAAFDEGWCKQQGSDGMEIPAAWRRADPPKKNKPADPPASPDPNAPPLPLGGDSAPPPSGNSTGPDGSAAHPPAPGA